MQDKLIEKPDLCFKFLLLGDRDSKKTNLLSSFADGDSTIVNRFNTIGVDFKEKIINIEGKKTKLIVWDTAGIERYRTITESYYRDARGFILVFNCESQASFDSLGRWSMECKRLQSENLKIMLIGINDNNNVAVDLSAATKFANDHQIQFKIVNTQTGDNVQEAFISLAKEVYNGKKNIALNNVAMLPTFFKNFSSKQAIASHVREVMVIAQGSRQEDGPFNLPNEILLNILQYLGFRLTEDSKSLRYLNTLLLDNIRGSKPGKLVWRRSLNVQDRKIEIYPEPERKCAIM